MSRGRKQEVKLPYPHLYEPPPKKPFNWSKFAMWVIGIVVFWFVAGLTAYNHKQLGLSGRMNQGPCKAAIMTAMEVDAHPNVTPTESMKYHEKMRSACGLQ